MNGLKRIGTFRRGRRAAWGPSPAGEGMRMLLPVLVILLLLLVLPTVGRGQKTHRVEVTAFVARQSSCSFSISGAALTFGPLDPASPVDVSADSRVSYVCTGVTGPASFFIESAEGGAQEQEATSFLTHTEMPMESIPYVIGLTPEPGTIPGEEGDGVLRVSGHISGRDYENVLAGAYEDTVFIVIER
jgi:spore coat protein U-like protein